MRPYQGRICFQESMTAEEKNQLRDKIILTIERLDGEIIRLKELTKPIPPENAIGRLSRMDAINNRSVNLAALRESESRLNKLKNALSRMDKPEFGNCAKCGQPIPLPRLMFRPESSRCVSCAR